MFQVISNSQWSGCWVQETNRIKARSVSGEYESANVPAVTEGRESIKNAT